MKTKFFVIFFILEIRHDPDVPWQRDEVFKLCPHALQASKATSETGNRKGRKALEYLLVYLVSEEP